MESKSEKAEELTTLLEEEKDSGNESNGSKFFLKAKGISSAFLNVIFIVLSIVSVQLLERRIPDFELNAFRFGIPLVIGSIVILVTRKWPLIEQRKIVATAVYSLIASGFSITLYTAATLLPAASVQSVMQTTSIASGILLFCIFLDDKPTVLVLISALMCMCGVVLVIQPPFIFVHGEFYNKSAAKFNNEEYTTNQTLNSIINFTQMMGSGKSDMENNNVVDMLKYALPIASGLCTTLDVLVVKKIPYLNEHIATVLFWSFLPVTILSAVVMFIVETPVLPSNWYDALLVTLHSMSNLFMWISYLYSLRYISGNTFNVISSTIIVFLLIAQYTVLSSILPGNRNWIEVVGVVLVLLGSGLGSVTEVYKAKK